MERRKVHQLTFTHDQATSVLEVTQGSARPAAHVGWPCRRASACATAGKAAVASRGKAAIVRAAQGESVKATAPAVCQARPELHRTPERGWPTGKVRPKEAEAIDAFARPSVRIASLAFPTNGRRIMERLHLTIEGMSCEHCVRAVRSRLERTEGVKLGAVDVGSATLEYDPAKTSIDDIEEAIADEGYTASVAE